MRPPQNHTRGAPGITRFDDIKDAKDIDTFTETSMENPTLGEEDYVPDTEGSVDDQPRR